MTTIDQARRVPGAIKEADQAQAAGMTAAQLTQVANNIDTGFFSFGAKKTKERLLAAAEILAARETSTAERTGATTTTAGPTATNQTKVEAPIDLAAQMRARAAETKENHAKIEADTSKRVTDMAAGWQAFDGSAEIKAFAEYVGAKHNEGAGKPEFPNARAIPLCSFDAPEVKLVSPGLSHEGLNLAFAIAGKEHLPYGKQTLVITPYGLRMAGETVGKQAHTKPVDTEMLARAGFSLSQLEERVKQTMKLVLDGKGPSPVTMQLGTADQALADAARLAGMSGGRADVDALLAKVTESISTTQRRAGADKVLELMKAEIPNMRPDDAIQFATKTLDYLGRINPRRGGQYGEDFNLWLFHRDYLKIGVAMTKLVNALPVEKRDLDPVRKAMDTYVSGVRSTSSCYRMIEPNGQETQDQYCGFYEIWGALKNLSFPYQGPGWGTMRDLGWLEKNAP
ncbi:MAG: hypothetical protein HYS27_06155 [Deltaproteobacteria bacterium]|nr:hypothetical protein [Deltaproteobacteria bacterium]